MALRQPEGGERTRAGTCIFGWERGATKEGTGGGEAGKESGGQRVQKFVLNPVTFLV